MRRAYGGEPPRTWTRVILIYTSASSSSRPPRLPPSDQPRRCVKYRIVAQRVQTARRLLRKAQNGGRRAKMPWSSIVIGGWADVGSTGSPPLAMQSGDSRSTRSRGRACLRVGTVSLCTHHPSSRSACCCVERPADLRRSARRGHRNLGTALLNRGSPPTGALGVCRWPRNIRCGRNGFLARGVSHVRCHCFLPPCLAHCALSPIPDI